ncbi:exodeoxyribonuclease VII large subunit [bacterium]|jgi:exodeoxyribonuclease VII large subunit|nr:exodeoxyribonuclease VII large subunit [bacterium]
MEQFQHFTVSQFNGFVKELIEGPPIFKNIWIKGELSGVKYYQYGQQLYFSVLEGDSKLSCVMYSRSIQSMNFKPANGDQVVIRGQLKLFHKKGQLVFQAHAITKDGTGEKSQKLSELKEKLTKEGLFDESAKTALPTFPKTIGLITAFKSAAMSDFFKVSRLIFPGVKLKVFPAVMQGDFSAPTIIESINNAKEYGKCDVLVLLRGGGSKEDLSSFNSEALVRAISTIDIPFVSAIGHESDWTLVDFVSDYRASTPSSAAQHLMSDYSKIDELFRAIVNNENLIKLELQSVYQELTYRLKIGSQKIESKLFFYQDKISSLIKRAESSNPLHKLIQGFSICGLKKYPVEEAKNKDVIEGSKFDSIRVLKTINGLKKGQRLQTVLNDGVIESEIVTIKKEKICL